MPKAARADRRHGASSRARQPTGPHAPLARYAYPQPVIRAAVVPYLACYASGVGERGTREARSFARGWNVTAPEDRLMRGRDSVRRSGCCPGGERTACKRSVTGSAEARTRCSRRARLSSLRRWWRRDRDRRPPALGGRGDRGRRCRRGDEIDLAAEPAPGVPTPTFLQSLLALIGARSRRPPPRPGCCSPKHSGYRSYRRLPCGRTMHLRCGSVRAGFLHLVRSQRVPPKIVPGLRPL